MNRRKVITIIITLFLLGSGLVPVLISLGTKPSQTGISPSSPPNTINNPTPTLIPPTKKEGLVEPVAEFKQRITKKFFGTYITPQNSPVQPERFSGYHTGVDVEYADITSEVPVKAIADGTVLLARYASGYGGVVAIQHTINDKPIVAIYGHLNPNQLPHVGQKIAAGEQIGILGKDKSSETDGERKHLHFGLIPGTSANIGGYVLSKTELSKWIDPLSLVE